MQSTMQKQAADLERYKRMNHFADCLIGSTVVAVVILAFMGYI